MSATLKSLADANMRDILMVSKGPKQVHFKIKTLNNFLVTDKGLRQHGSAGGALRPRL